MRGTIGNAGFGQLGIPLMSREESRPVMPFRVWIAAVAALLLLLLGPAVAHANHPFSVSKTEAAAGDEVEFQISGTQAGESYIIKVDDREVASGVDSAGNGVSDKFKMPDFGGSNQAVSVEVRVTLGNEDHLGSQPMQYLAAFAGGSGSQPAAQPAPVPTVPAPEQDPGAGVAEVPRNPDRPRPTVENPGPTGDPSPKPENKPPSNPASPPTDLGTGSGSSGPTTSDSSPVSVNRPADVPGPSGPNAPVGTSLASVLSPLSGLAEPGKTGFPILLILLIVLLVATALTAAGPRLWQHWEPALPWGTDVDDDMRLGALGRASASGAELQQTIAKRRAMRSAGRAS